MVIANVLADGEIQFNYIISYKLGLGQVLSWLCVQEGINDLGPMSVILFPLHPVS